MLTEVKKEIKLVFLSVKYNIMRQMINPLSFTLSLLDSKQCNAKIENVNIVDNVIKIDGKIFVKGD